MRHLEPAGLARVSARKCAALVPKKFRFDEFRRKARAINLQEGRIAARTMLVNPARELIFAGPALAVNQKVVAVSASFSAISRTLFDAGSADIQAMTRRAHGCAAPLSNSPRVSAGLFGAGKSMRSAFRHSRSRS